MSRKKEVLAGAAIAVTMSIPVPAPGAQLIEAAGRNFSFSGCSWQHITQQNDHPGWGSLESVSKTFDRNDGCRYLDADLKYFQNGSSGPTVTKWCSSQITSLKECNKSQVYHHQGRGRAQSEETDHWQSSGWWG